MAEKEFIIRIKNKIDSLKLNGKQYTTIYMSLYGISNLEEISKKIFIKKWITIYCAIYGRKKRK